MLKVSEINEVYFLTSEVFYINTWAIVMIGA
jgi:hypothetical protein